jgi:hypothetical protein
MSQELGMEFKQCTKNVGGEGSYRYSPSMLEGSYTYSFQVGGILKE